MGEEKWPGKEHWVPLKGPFSCDTSSIISNLISTAITHSALRLPPSLHSRLLPHRSSKEKVFGKLPFLWFVLILTGGYFFFFF